MEIDFNSLDTNVHGPLRLGVLTRLQAHGPTDFTSLKKRLNAVDGSLSMHLQKLEKAGYVDVEKSFVGRRPKSTYSITQAGKTALLKYLDAMQKIIDTLKADC